MSVPDSATVLLTTTQAGYQVPATRAVKWIVYSDEKALSAHNFALVVNRQLTALVGQYTIHSIISFSQIYESRDDFLALEGSLNAGYISINGGPALFQKQVQCLSPSPASASRLFLLPVVRDTC
ncbi:hypothetical protein EVAR_15890_1 [Eumeta japonica]|uniref:Uncharacterized protein n=1 Tax=Eumeta variegata TaxID=151549 RepID=A0A4C1UFJ1_EUMVA|nr:hypothetical protein EVAR_15890_1 [Eumeta japonica]